MNTMSKFWSCLLLAATGAAANRYEITATMDPAAGVISGTTRLTYTNDSSGPLDRIELMCRGKMDRDARVALSPALQPGQSTTLEIAFTTPLPAIQNGYRLFAGAWHPKAAVFRDGRFQPDESQADDYDVTLAAPAGEVIATSGKPVEQTATGTHYRARGITSFGLAFSPDFQVTERAAGAVTIRSYYLPGGEKWGVRLADYAARIIPFYRKTFGFYPQETLAILPGSKRSTGGYPPASSMIMIHDTLDAAGGEVFAEWITSHEIGHQYWGWDCVIDSFNYHRWPGIPLGIYTDRLYTEAFNPKSTAHRGFVDTYLGGVANGYDTTIYRTNAELDKLNFDTNNIVEHGKAFAVIQMLEEVMGKEKFLRLVRLLLERYRGRYLSPQAFEAAASEVHGASLDWFFREWVHENKVLTYEIESVAQSGGQTRVKVKRTGAATLAMPLEVTFADGAKMRQTIAADPETQELNFTSAARPVRAQLDPDRRLPIYSPEARQVWGRRTGMVGVQMPELAWGSNVAVVTLRNGDDRPHEITLHIQANVPHRGFGWQTKHTIAAGAEVAIERPFLLGIFPGKARVRVQAIDTTDNIQIGWRTFETEFPLANSRIHPLDVPEPLRSWPNFKKPAYPPLKMIERGQFVFYILSGDTWAESRLDEIAAQRQRAYAEITKMINPAYHERVALYLFPDAETKLAYTGHTGMGWAPGGNVLVEIFNEKERVDPNHELVHIVAGSLGDPPAMFSEGLAAYLQEGHKWEGHPVDAWAKAFADRDLLVPLARLVTFTEIGSEQSQASITYPESASVVHYLIDHYGIEKFLAAYRDVKRAGFAAVFGAPVEEVEKAWLASLKNIDAAGIPR